MGGVTVLLAIGVGVVLALLLVSVPYLSTRYDSTPSTLRCSTSPPPTGWRPLPLTFPRGGSISDRGAGGCKGCPFSDGPPRPFANRVSFYIGAEWPDRFRQRYNLPHPDQCTHAVLIDVEALRSYGVGGRLYRRRIDRSAAWSGEYRGPGHIIKRETPEATPIRRVTRSPGNPSTDGERARSARTSGQSLRGSPR